MNDQISRVHISILKTLRQNQTVRFSDLMKPTGMQSDNFKFYLRNVVALGYIEKDTKGLYHLTAIGKAYANSLDEEAATRQKQPKVSVIVIVEKQHNGETLFLVQKRHRSPFFGYWGFISGPISRGELATETARRELYKQTGIEASSFTTTSFYRGRVYLDESPKRLIDDTFFTVLRTTPSGGVVSGTWKGGSAKWVSQTELAMLSPQFQETQDLIIPDITALTYYERDVIYTTDEY